MIAYFVYITVVLILLFIIYIGVKAFIKGIRAKNRNRSQK